MQQQENPVAWLVTGGNVFVDRVFMSESHAIESATSREDGAIVVALYRRATDERVARLVEASEMVLKNYADILLSDYQSQSNPDPISRDTSISELRDAIDGVKE